ncbi:MAG: DUF3426 domain-containing protein [Gammaproteobacteria bacterium]|nr:DUF3426 domain-containing protein [Gammaproteobacteria bacterium]
MHTQCPHCKTLFKISEEQLAAVNGKVRCGFCYRIFFSEESLFDELPNIDINDASPPPPEATHQITTEPTKISAVSDMSTTAMIETVHFTQNELQKEARQRLEQQNTKKKSTFSSFAWTFGTLAFVIILILQYGYFMRDNLAQYTSLRPALQQLCRVADCTLPLQHAPTQIKLISREISTHPDIDNALRVQATFINKAPFQQNYPTIKLSLSSLAGQTIATRYFKPQEYLPQNTSIETGIATQQQTEVQLDIRDPDKKATGFELLFL